MQSHNTALIDDTFQHIVMLLVVPCYKESSPRIVFIQYFKDLVGMCGRAVVKCEVDDFPVIVPVLFDSDLADSGAFISGAVFGRICDLVGAGRGKVHLIRIDGRMSDPDPYHRSR